MVWRDGRWASNALCDPADRQIDPRFGCSSFVRRVCPVPSPSVRAISNGLAWELADDWGSILVALRLIVPLSSRRGVLHWPL